MRLAAGIAVLGTLAVCACGSSSSKTSTVDDAAVESGVKSQLSTPQVEVTSVKCPKDEKAEKGAMFTCSVSWDNAAAGQVKVTQTTAGPNYVYEPVAGSVMVPGATVEKSLQAELAKQGAPSAQVNCPDNIIVKLDTTVTCDVSSASGKAGGTVTFAFSSVEGTVDPSSVQTG